MKEIVLAHSELTHTIYALIGKDKIDITEQAIAEVKAIKALEQEPWDDMEREYEKAKALFSKVVKSEDCISRQIISDYVESHIQEINTEYGDLNSHTNRILRMIVDYIENMPSVTPIRPKGHWIEHEESISTAFKHLRECSCCKCYFDWLMPRNSYCPNCGAKMESEG